MGRSFSNEPDPPVSSRFGLRARTPPTDVKPRTRARASKTAPAIRYPFGQTRSLKVSLAALWLCGALVTLYLLLTWPVHALYPWLAGFSLLMGASAARWGWASTQAGFLRWDGEDWWVEPPNDVAMLPPRLVTDIRVQLDFQFFLLLRLDSAGGGSQWLWLDSWSQRRDWHALRRSVFSPKPSPQASDSAVVSAEPPLTAGVKA